MENLNAGTKEIVSISVEDRLGTITDLGSYAVEFRITDTEEQTEIDWASVTNVNNMRVDCLIDTTTLTRARFFLYIRITIGSEVPILGPFEFSVV